MEGPRSTRLHTKWLGVSLAVAIILCMPLFSSKSASAQTLQTVNMAIPSKSFQMAIYPIAQQKGYMKEEGLDQRVIFVAPTTSIQAMLGGDVQFTGAGSSALVSIARGNTPLKVVVATNDRVLQWFVTRPEITQPKELKGKKIATTGVAAISTFMIKQVLTKHGLDGNKDVTYLDVGQGNQLAALLGGGFDAAMLSVEQRYVALDKGMREMFFMGNEVKIPGGRLPRPTSSSKKIPRWWEASCAQPSRRCVTSAKIGKAPSQRCKNFPASRANRRPVSTTTSSARSRAAASSTMKPKETISILSAKSPTRAKPCPTPAVMTLASRTRPTSS